MKIFLCRCFRAAKGQFNPFEEPVALWTISDRRLMHAFIRAEGLEISRARDSCRGEEVLRSVVVVRKVIYTADKVLDEKRRVGSDVEDRRRDRPATKKGSLRPFQFPTKSHAPVQVESSQHRKNHLLHRGDRLQLCFATLQTRGRHLSLSRKTPSNRRPRQPPKLPALRGSS